MKITIQDAIKELERELKMRASLYPKWIVQGKLNRDRANRQFLSLKKALDLIEKQHHQETKTGKQRELFG